MTRDPRTTLLICNGRPPSRSLLRRLASGAGRIVAADGGADSALRAGLRPDVLVGDLDSVRPATLKKLRGALILRVRRQDNTDLEKALDLIAAGGRTRVLIAGATGGRIDFTLGNLSVIWNYTERLDLEIAGDGWRALPVAGRLRMTAPKGVTASLVPFGPCAGITLRGLKYPLTNARMRVGEIGVSNVVVKSPFTVTVRRGHMLLVVFERTGKPGGARAAW